MMLDENRYESPIERIFAWHCSKYLESGIGFDSQVEVDTVHGKFRVDFLLSAEVERVAVECDGRDFHNNFRDEFRDAILLGEGHFDTIYHFRGCDLTYYPEDCIWLMSLLNPALFSERGRLSLNQLHRLEVCPELYTGESYILKGPVLNCGGLVVLSPRFWAFRRNIYLRSSRNPNWPHWRNLYKFACEHPRAGLDELLNLRQAQ